MGIYKHTIYPSRQGNWVSMNILNILDRKATRNLVQWWEWCANGSVNRNFMNLRYAPSLLANHSTPNRRPQIQCSPSPQFGHLPWGKQCNVNSDEDCLLEISCLTTCLRMLIDGFEMFVQIDHSTNLELFVEVICDHALAFSRIRFSIICTYMFPIFVHKVVPPSIQKFPCSLCFSINTFRKMWIRFVFVNPYSGLVLQELIKYMGSHPDDFPSRDVTGLSGLAGTRSIYTMLRMLLDDGKWVAQYLIKQKSLLVQWRWWNWNLRGDFDAFCRQV